MKYEKTPQNKSIILSCDIILVITIALLQCEPKHPCN